MKKLTISLLTLILLLVACADNEENETTEPVEEDNIAEEQTEDNDNIEATEKDIENDKEETSEEQEEIIEAQYYIDENSSVVPLGDGVEEDVVLLTIDDAPATYTLEMAEILSNLDANAIFFVNGHFLDSPEEEEALKQIHEMGFLIGNHTYSHPVIPDIPEDEQYEEIISLSDRVEEIIGERPKFFRAPHGMNSDYSKAVVEEDGMVLMNWTYGYDYFEPYMNAEKLTEAMITGEAPEIDIDYSLLKPGANLLMHDREWTKDALEGIVLGLRENGYEIVDPNLIEVK
ncbi:polysaccharide deacetylase family protein [Oceanobacillus sp. CAU 1775]